MAAFLGNASGSSACSGLCGTGLQHQRLAAAGDSRGGHAGKVDECWYSDLERQM
jgi:hypothetical protein